MIKKNTLNIVETPRMLIACDLDGTLLNKKGEITDFSIEVVKKIVKQGHIFCISTGRPKHAAVHLYKQLGLNSLLINYNGSLISNPSNKSFSELNLGFSNSILKKIFQNKNIYEWAANIMIENTEGTFVWKKAKSIREEKVLFEHFHISREHGFKYFNENMSNIKADVHSILIDLKKEEYLNDLIYAIKTISSTLSVRTWSLVGTGMVIEINSIFSSKGTALKYLSSYYGIPLDSCVAFGDGDNDAEMLRKAFYGYAMKNGSPTSKLSSRFLTEFDNEKNGVAIELKKMFGI